MRRLLVTALFMLVCSGAMAQTKEPIALRDMGSFHIGGRIVELCSLGPAHSRGDQVVFLPEERVLFTGDLVIWQAPNCGNPQKMQRYAEEWAEALEAMAAMAPSGSSRDTVSSWRAKRPCARC